ncbi:MAG TPA: LacI family DNA-binding transcriptional regulator [Alphaproteobacteria bacterium]
MKTNERPTIVDVARVAKVSVATVSNALNGHRRVDVRTRERVKAAALKLGYTPNLRARRLRTGRADTIAIFSSMPFAVAAGPSRLGFLMEIAAAAAASALESGIALVLVPPLEKGRAPFKDLQIDGALVIEPTADDPDVAILRGRGIPVVSIGRQARATDLPFVDIQSSLTCRLLLDHLYGQSARRIALLIGAQARNSYLEAQRTYLQFVAEKKMPPLISRIDETGGESMAHEQTRHLLREHRKIDAICAPVDVFAVGACKAATELGLKIPETLKLATRYDGVRARECRPSLTAVNLHLDELAVLGVRLLLEQINGVGGGRSVMGPRPALVIRESSVLPPVAPR